MYAASTFRRSSRHGPTISVGRRPRSPATLRCLPRRQRDKARSQLELYSEHCARHRREGVVKAIRRDVYVGETATEAESTGGAVVAAGYRGFSPRALVGGDVERVAVAFAELAEMGFTDIIARNLVPDPARAVASTERLGKVRELVSAL